MIPSTSAPFLPKEENIDGDPPAIEPQILLPPAVSSLSLNDFVLETETVKRLPWFTRFSGIIYALLASFLFTCSSFSTKQLGVDLLDALVLRFFIQISFTFIFVLYKKYQLLPGTTGQILLQLLCCATGASSFFLYFFAIRYVDISDVTTLGYTRVVWTVVFSICVYRERPALSTLVALPLTLLGVIFVTQPSFFFASARPSTVIVNSYQRILGLSLALVSSMISASNVLLFKQLVSTSKDIKPSVLNFQYCSAVFVFLIVNQLYKRFVLNTGLTLTFILSWRYISASLICLVMILVNILTQTAIKREHPAVFTLLGSSDIIFSLILQNIFTSKRSNLFALLGSALVICSVVIIGVAKIHRERRAQKKIESVDHRQRKVIREFEEKA